MSLFKLHSPFKPCGSQPEAISKLVKDRPGMSTLLGVTGSGKTLTIAHVIAQQDKPVLILSPNKTLAAQLYEEFNLFFPENKVCYFVSYYDYYQPESYMPAQDLYVAKETKVNSEIERLRIEATASLINRRDTIVIASISSIYSLGNPTDYKNLALQLSVGMTIKRSELLSKLVFVQYKRNDVERLPGTFSARGNTVEVQLPYHKDVLRIELFGSTIESLQWISRVERNVMLDLDNTIVFPAKHFVTTEAKKERAIVGIKQELDRHSQTLQNPVYKQRIIQRVSHDLEMMKEVGYCSGIENYSSFFEGRKSGEPPHCLLDFFGDDFLFVVDESHIALPQMRGMFAGDQARKKMLIEYGFRLPSAADNRPLKFEEIEPYFKDAIFVSATPGDYELAHSHSVVQQVIRPTGLVDPQVFVRGREGQIQHLIKEIKQTIESGYRSIVMVLTKKMAEELAYYLEERQLKVCYMHSELKTPKRTELLNKLRQGIFDVMVGVNLLREGIDLPEVALVAIMDADTAGFLRDKRSLIQIIGRAARNVDSKVFLYADKMTAGMRAAIDETGRRRALQVEYNKEHGVTPTSVKRDVTKTISGLQDAIAKASKNSGRGKKSARERDSDKLIPLSEVPKYLQDLEERMRVAAQEFDFELAIKLRDQWNRLKKRLLK
ncbi:excinuclease ABC subunit UvrB [bacterium]|jgi:excinuclease ABC subunit B|nr:excinuclease ABC subunit UvrB [bacterium]MBT3903488.1 excinuclease ABC subunit UvrB [bacterium]MBT5346246.1 excinuclease ABC subunit UvrB [bacterium]